MHGAPLTMMATVLWLTDGRFVNKGIMSAGVHSNRRLTAVMEVEGENGGNMFVIITTHRKQPTDLEMIRGQGIEPTDQQILVVKSFMHYRSAFIPIAKKTIEVDTPGRSSPHLDRLEFRRIPRPIYPFEPDMERSNP